MADNILRLKIDSKEYDDKLKRASEAITRYIDGCRKVGGTLEVVERDTQKYVQTLGQMNTVSRTAKGRLNEMVKAYTDLSMQYNSLSETEKASPFGQSLNASLSQLRERVRSYREELNGVSRSIGEATQGTTGWRDVLDVIGGKLGVNSSVLEICKTGTIGLTAAIGASVAAVYKAATAWDEYNEKLEERDNATMVTTGLKGADVSDMTDRLSALSDTYNVDFRNAVNAANTLMAQFGMTGNEAIQLLRDGMQGMIDGDGEKLLNMIQQYAPAFNDAGVSASQLIAIIHNSEGGIFTDENMNAIVMGIKNLRIMSSSTAQALASIGINGQDMAKKLSDGTMTVFEALKLVSDRLQETKEGSQAAGEVLQTVFGKQGAKAGVNIGKAISTLNTNLEETKKQTGEVGEKMKDLELANERLAKAEREAFGTEGWAGLKKELETGVVNAFATVLEKVSELKNKISEMGLSASNFLYAIFPRLNVAATILGIASGQNGGKGSKTHYGRLPGGRIVRDGEIVGGYKYYYSEEKGHFLRRRMAPAKKAATSSPKKKYGNYTPKKAKAKKTKTHTTKSTSTPKTEEQLNNEKINKLTQEYVYASTERRQAIVSEIKALQDRNEEIDKLKDDAQSKASSKGSADDIKEQISLLEKFRQSTTITNEEWINIQKQIDAAKKRLEELTKTDFSKNTPANVEGFISSLRQEISNTDFGDPIRQKLTEQLSDAKMYGSIIEEALKEGINLTDFDTTGIWKKILDFDTPGNSMDIDEALGALFEKINEYRSQNGLPALKMSPDGDMSEDSKSKGNKVSGEDLKSVVTQSGKVVSGLSSVASGLQAMGIKMPEGVQKVISFAQGLISVIQGVSSIIQVFSATSQGANTVAVNANTVALGTVAGALMANSATNMIPFAHGGVVHAASGFRVPGNSYSGDLVPALLNSGETVLNQAQTGNLAAQLEDPGGLKSLRLSTEFDAEKIIITLNNNGRRTGRGELVTSNIKLW